MTTLKHHSNNSGGKKHWYNTRRQYMYLYVHVIQDCALTSNSSWACEVRAILDQDLKKAVGSQSHLKLMYYKTTEIFIFEKMTILIQYGNTATFFYTSIVVAKYWRFPVCLGNMLYKQCISILENEKLQSDISFKVAVFEIIRVWAVTLVVVRTIS